MSRIPIATYRLQLNKDFGFKEAAALAPYLKALGVSHLYASPFLAARKGSTHGYDVVDHTRFNEELGGEAGFDELSSALRANGLGLILDFVPNHMGIGLADNAWWLDVLEWGQKSPHAAAFDIDWQGLPYRQQPGVLLPILGKPYGDVLQAGEIELRYDARAGSFAAWYFEHKLPIDPRRYAEMLRTIVAHADAATSEAGKQLLALAEKHQRPSEPSYARAPEFKRALALIPDAAAVITRGLAAYRGEQNIPALHRLLERQAYHLAYWRVAFSAINYRRFFDINDLAGLRAEHPATFHAMHGLVARLIAEDKLQGIRLDHVDGLRDPAQYIRRLREVIRRVRPDLPRGAYYVLIEKILGENEPLPALGDDGTTGYERLNLISRALLDGRGLASLEKTWREFTGEQQNFAEILRAAKLRVLDSMLASEFTVLTRALGRIAAGHFSSRDYTLDRLGRALQAYVLEFPVYRTYITTARTPESDRATINGAIARARASWSGPDPEIFDFMRDAITGDLARNNSYSAPRVRNFAFKLQQFTGPLTAKSLEDTAFYRHHRLVALNEVGGRPDAGALDVNAFHERQTALQRDMPHGLVATATHDTKRGEDARMRILALAELTDEWRTHVARWREMNSRFVEHDEARRPSSAHEYLLYQALVGAWPGENFDARFIARFKAYALKAAREGKRETSWTNPDERYEKALQKFVADVLASPEFLADAGPFMARTALIGALNGLSQLALKLTLPGVPDFFQGSELWDFSLVDPDNRRPVDFSLRRELLSQSPKWPDLVTHWRDGRIKMLLMRRLLKARNLRADLFRDGRYEAIAVEGRDRDHVIAFKRWHRDQVVVVAVGRHFAPLSDHGQAWPKTVEARMNGLSGRFVDLLREDAAVADPADLGALFAELPVAVLARA